MRERGYLSGEHFAEFEKKQLVSRLGAFLEDDLGVCIRDIEPSINRAVLTLNHAIEAPWSYHLSIGEDITTQEHAYIYLRTASDVMLGTLQRLPIVAYPHATLASVKAYNPLHLRYLMKSASLTSALMQDLPVTAWSDDIQEELKRRPQGWQQAVEQHTLKLQQLIASPQFKDQLQADVQDLLKADIAYLLQASS